MKLAQLLISAVLVSSVSTTAAQTPVKPPVTFGTINQAEFQTDWALTDQEMADYTRYMQTTGRFFYSHLDPLMVLGFIEADPEKRAQFAERHLIKSRQRITQELSFVHEVTAAQNRLFPGEKPFDFSKVAGYQKHKARRAALVKAVSHGKKNALSAPPIKASISSFKWHDASNVISVDYWVTDSCDTCLQTVKDLLRSTPNTVIINLYADRNETHVLNEVRNKLDPVIHPARVVTSKVFDPVLFDGLDKERPIVRRNGVVVAIL